MAMAEVTKHTEITLKLSQDEADLIRTVVGSLYGKSGCIKVHLEIFDALKDVTTRRKDYIENFELIREL